MLTAGSDLLGGTEVDSTPALILCVAVNVEQVYIHDEHVMHLTRKCPSTPWTDDITGPFHRLKALTIGPRCGRPIAPLIPSMESLQSGSSADFLGKYHRDIHSARIDIPDIILLPPKPLPPCPLLRRLAFVGMEKVTPGGLAQILSSSGLKNVKELIMSHCGYCTMFDRELYNICDLLRAMKKHLPGLDSFEYTRLAIGDGSPGPDKFDTFMNLKRLRSLAVDIDMVTLPIKDSFSTMSDPYNLFPKSLQNLTLNSFSVSRIHHLVSLFH